MALCIGAPATGEHFFNRTVEKASLWKALELNHLVLSAPRRLGKTSLLRYLEDTAADRGLFARHIDASPCANSGELVAAIDNSFAEEGLRAHVRRVAHKTKDWISSTTQRIRRVNAANIGGVDLDPVQHREETWLKAFDALERRLGPEPVLIILDEFSVFLERLLRHDLVQAEILLSKLRRWRQRAGIPSRFVLTGSIGLNRLLERYGLGRETNDCKDIPLGPFQPLHAIEMLIECARREGWPLDHAAAERLCRHVGWLSPFYLMLALDQSIYAAMERHNIDAGQGIPLETQDVDTGIARLLDTRSVFSDNYKRLDKHFDSTDLPTARSILAHVCRSEKGALSSTLSAKHTAHKELDDIFLVLEEHGYLAREGERMTFQSPLLRAYWRRNHFHERT